MKSKQVRDMLSRAVRRLSRTREDLEAISADEQFVEDAADKFTQTRRQEALDNANRAIVEAESLLRDTALWGEE